MATKRVKIQEHEKLTNANIARVISLLEAEKPITKKEACEILNISYNTARLSNIIDGFKAKAARDKELREKNRGKPLTEFEIQEAVQKYLNGETVTDIANGLHRPAPMIKGLIIRLGVPTRVPFEQQAKPALLPEQCVAEEFRPGQKAWSAVYHSPCEVIVEVTNKDYLKKYGARCYKIYIYEPLEERIDGFPTVEMGGYYAYTLAYDLGSLDHLLEYGIKL